MVVFHDRADLGEGSLRLALGEKRGGRFELRRFGKIDFGNGRDLVTDLAAARADLHFAHNYIARNADALGLNRLAGFKENVLRIRRPDEDEEEQERESESFHEPCPNASSRFRASTASVKLASFWLRNSSR